MSDIFKLAIQAVASYYVLISIVLLAIITVLSLSPLSDLPDVGGGDKLHHLIAYMGLALPVAIKGGSRWVWILVFYLAWSGAIELVQPSMNRYAEWADFIINGAGLILGAIIGSSLRKVFLKINT